MIDVALSSMCVRKLKRALVVAGSNEIGGVLAAEQAAYGRFVVVDLSIQSDGSCSDFQRDPVQHREFIRRFHDRTGRRPEQFNYLGEWHSHPSYPAIPSAVDFSQMKSLVEDDEQQSTFLVLIVVKLGMGGELRGSVHGFRPGLMPVRGQLYGIGAAPVHEEHSPLKVVPGKADRT